MNYIYVPHTFKQGTLFNQGQEVPNNPLLPLAQNSPRDEECKWLNPLYNVNNFPYKYTAAVPSDYVMFLPPRPNPGGLDFSMYWYPYQTADGKPLSHPGKGWYGYEHTGKYPWFQA